MNLLILKEKEIKMDIKINNADLHFKFRVCGVLQHKNRYLTTQIEDNTFYCLPGGHSEIYENTEEATIREMEEELGFPIKIKRLLAIAQNFFVEGSEKWHEFSYYYLVEAKNLDDVNENDYVRFENDKGIVKRLEFKWLTKEEFQTVDFRPHFVVDLLSSNKPVHIINYDNRSCDIKEF